MASWNEQLTTYFTNMKRTAPELTEGCEVSVMVAEVEYMDARTILEWLEIDGEDFTRMLSGECVKLRKFCEVNRPSPEYLYYPEEEYIELYESWPAGRDVVDHIALMMDLSINEVLQMIERAAP